MLGIAALHDDKGLRFHQAGFCVAVGVRIKYTVSERRPAAQIGEDLLHKPLVIYISTGFPQTFRCAEALRKKEIVHMDDGGIQPLDHALGQSGFPGTCHTVNGDDRRCPPFPLELYGLGDDVYQVIFKILRSDRAHLLLLWLLLYQFYGTKTRGFLILK